MPAKGWRGGRKILDVNKPVRERQKPGPKPKPKPDPCLVDPATYVPPPKKHPQNRYTNQQMIEVLQFLYYYRILDRKPDGTAGEKLPRYRSGTILQKRPDLAVAPEGFRYRSPTYEEAADWFQIPKSTVSTWWNTKLEMIGVFPEEVPQAPMPDFLKNRPVYTPPQAQPQPPPQPPPQPQPQPQRQAGPVAGTQGARGNPVVASYIGVPVVPGQPGPGQPGAGQPGPGPGQIAWRQIPPRQPPPEPVMMNGPVHIAPRPHAAQVPSLPPGASTPMQGVVGPAQGAVLGPGQRALAPMPQQNGVVPSAVPVVQGQPAPSPGGQEAPSQSPHSAATDTPTPTPSEQLAEVSRFNEEASAPLDKEMSSSGAEDNGEEEEEDDDEEEEEEEEL